MTFLRKRNVRIFVLPALIVVGGLLGQRLAASMGPGPEIDTINGATQVRQSQTVPQFRDDSGPDYPSELSMEIGPVPGLTTQWYPAPSSTSIPLGSAVEFQVAISPGVPITWTGATESYRTEEASVASCLFAEVGQFTVMAHIVGTRTSVASSFDVLDIDAGEITVEPIEVSVSLFEIDLNLPEEELNEQTMAYFFGESIAALHDLGAGQYRTSVRRTLHMSTKVTPAGFEPLVEWRVDGAAQQLGLETSKKFFYVAAHDISVGPLESPQIVEVETYNVWITSHVNGEDVVPEGEPITFTAQTVPAGYEDDITWLSSTKFGTGTPVLGHGPTFTVQFDDTWGLDNQGLPFQWLGARADNSQFGQDQKTGACCLGGDACEESTGLDCDVLEGSYLGDGTSCIPGQCGDPDKKCDYSFLSWLPTVPCTHEDCNELPNSECLDPCDDVGDCTKDWNAACPDEGGGQCLWIGSRKCVSTCP